MRTAFARQTRRTTTGNLSAPLFLLNFNVEGYVLDFNEAILCVFRPEKRITRENAFHMFAFNCWARNENPKFPVREETLDLLHRAISEYGKVVDEEERPG